MRPGTAGLAVLLLAAPALAERASLEQAMADPIWIGARPSSPYWADDDQSIYFERGARGCDEKELLQILLPDGETRLVADDERGAVDAAGGARDAARRRKAWIRAGDLYWRDLTNGAVRQLTRTEEAESAPHWLSDGRLAFRRGERLLARDPMTGLEEELALLRFEKEPGAEDEGSWLAAQNERLFEHVRDRRDRRDASRRRDAERRAADPTLAPAPWYLGEKNERRRAEISPDGRHLLVTVAASDRQEGRRDLLPSWITEDGYVSEERVRPKVGTGEPRAERLLLLDLVRHESSELDLSGLPDIAQDPLAGLRAAANAADRTRGGDDDAAASRGERRRPRGRHARDEETPAPRPLRVLDVSWSDDGARALVGLRSHDNKDRWLVVVEAESGAVITLHHLHDAAWIDWRHHEAGWFPGGRRVWYLSEEPGWSQLFVRGLDGRPARALTSGRQVVEDPRLSLDGRRLWFTANPGNPGVREVFRVDVESGRVEQLTRLGGLNSYELSHDERRLVVRHSETTRPPELWLQDAEPGATARALTDSRSPAFRAIDWVAPRHVTIASSQGAGRIHGRLYRPEGAAPPGGRPAVLFIHGAGYLQDAHEGWSSYEHEFMFHSLLVDRGFAVLDLDYRGSAGYGRDWRTAIYRNMGGPELEDLRDGVTWLVENAGVDRHRVGCYGGSYGGFLTFMALFKDPDLFAAGAALRPVADWAHYNHGYTSNILNTPELDPEAYRRSSPIEHAAGLRRPLLICSPMLDDNVLFLDSVRLVQRLIELGKTEWFETAIYPVESHGFKEPASWLDEYRRILRHLERHLLGPDPEGAP